MSQYFFERSKLGDFGLKKSTRGCCSLEWCSNSRSIFKGPGERLCAPHQIMLREYGGPARLDRPWTFNKKTTCDFCGKNPWDHPMVKKIDDPLVRDRVANGMLIVDHIHTQRDGGNDHPDNCQTLCLDCNQIKSTLACDTMPKSLYKDEKEMQKLVKAYKDSEGDEKEKIKSRLKTLTKIKKELEMML